MKLKKKQQQFIKDAYNSSDVCQEWKDKIKDAFPKLFESTELIVGKWYKDSLYNRSLYCITKVQKSLFRYNGFNPGGDWCVDDFYNFDESVLIPATDKEVEQALIKEAKKRGVWNVPVINVYGESRMKYLETLDDEIQDGALWSKYGKIFENGVWAKPINTITKKEAEEKLNCIIIDD